MSRHYIHISAVKEHFCLAADVTMLLNVRENKSTLRQSNSTSKFDDHATAQRGQFAICGSITMSRLCGLVRRKSQ